MKLVKPKYEIWEQPAGLEGIYKQIEKAGRVCYKSEDKITENSAKSFVDRMIASGHGAMLEHGTVYLKLSDTVENSYIVNKYMNNRYSLVKDAVHRKNCHGDLLFTSNKCITTNYRVLVENNWLDDLEYLCEPTEYHAKRITVKFIMDRIGSQSFCRHRVFSFAQESTRYCNYSRDKFNNEVTFIIPCWLDIPEDTYSLGKLRSKNNPEETCLVEISENNGAYNVESPIGKFLHVLDYSSDRYIELVNEGWKPQQARAVLPNSLKTELVMTGFINDWKHFFDLRCATNAHPQAQELAIPLKEEFIKRGYINE